MDERAERGPTPLAARTSGRPDAAIRVDIHTLSTTYNPYE
jgi:hypothetical protein